MGSEDSEDQITSRKKEAPAGDGEPCILHTLEQSWPPTQVPEVSFVSKDLPRQGLLLEESLPLHIHRE